GLLVLGHLEDGVDRLLLGFADEAAGVDDDDLGGLWRLYQLVARVGRVAEHDLRVDAIFRATKGDEVHVHLKSRFRKVGKTSMPTPAAARVMAGLRKEQHLVR